MTTRPLVEVMTFSQRSIASLSFCVLAASLLTTPLSAQDSRVAAVEQEISEKAQRLEPYQPGTIERIILFVETNPLIRRFWEGGDGWYPRFGGLPTGSGTAMGPGYRTTFGHDGKFDISAAGSLKSYLGAQAQLRFPSFAGERVVVDLVAGYRHYPEERFYGLGESSRPDDRTSYLLEGESAVAGAAFWPTSPVRGGMRVGYTTNRVGSGERVPSIESIFSPAGIPGLVEQPDFLHAEGYVEVDYRDYPGNPRRGGYHRVSFSRFDDRKSGRYDFSRFDAEATQFVPFLDKRRVLAFHALDALTDAADGGDVPFYAMPVLGGPDSLRGFHYRRFTDRNAVVVNAEYRYEIFAALDMALFVDAGTVAPRLEELRLRNMKTDYGIGFRFGTRANLLGRFDIGRSREGTRYFLKFNRIF